MDGVAREAIELFAWLLARSGCPREEAWLRFKNRLERIPLRIGRTSASGTAIADEAAHVVTLWNMMKDYLNDEGEPIPLPVRGPGPSIEALVDLTGHELTVENAMGYLCSTGALRKRRSLYVPAVRMIKHRVASPLQAAHHLRVATGLLRTVEHNSRKTGPWFEVAADGRIPASKRRIFYRDFRAVGVEMMEQADAFLLRHAGGLKGKERKIPVTVGIYVFEGGPLKNKHSPKLKSTDRKPRSVAKR